jgi:hypothetical protein
MAAKKKRKGAAPRKPKKHAGRPVKKKVRAKPKVQPGADILDNTPTPVADAEALPFRAEAPPPPYRPSSPPHSMNWGAHDNTAPWMWQPTRNAALLASTGAVEPPVPLTASPLITSSPAIGSPALHAEMIKQIEALEPKIDSLREQQRHGIGHNNPPEPIETAPLSRKRLGEIKKAMAVLKKEPPAPTAPSSEARAAVALLTKFARAAGAYVGKRADDFITAAAKKAGEKVGERIVDLAYWSAIIYGLQKLADLAQRWLESLGPHF